MNVTVVAGGTSGSIAITVEPTLTSGNSYKYKLAANPTMPAYGQECRSGYTVWNGTGEITAAVGQKIIVVEVDAANKCVGTGAATVES